MTIFYFQSYNLIELITKQGEQYALREGIIYIPRNVRQTPV